MAAWGAFKGYLDWHLGGSMAYVWGVDGGNFGGLWLWVGQDWFGHLCLDGLWPCVWLLAFGVWVSHGGKA